MPQAPHTPTHDDADPSMDDILASIRRILSDEEKAAKPHAPDDGVLMLDPSMMIDDSAPEPIPLPQESHRTIEAEPDTLSNLQRFMHTETAAQPPASAPGRAAEPTPAPAPSTAMVPLASPSPYTQSAPESDDLVAPEAAAAAASSVGALMRTLAAERAPLDRSPLDRATAVHRGGPSIEDLVREEFQPLLNAWLDTHMASLVERLVREETRPLLKGWLDSNLPELVERLVRTEIERVVGRIER